MLANYPLGIMRELDKSPATFYLTGSRFFQECGNDTDFFTEFSEEIYHWLAGLGFKDLTARSNYKDAWCISVMRKGLIDVQLVQNAQLKDRVQHYFKKRGVLSPSTEQWNEAFHLATELAV